MDKIKCKRVNRVTRFKKFPIITLLTTFSHFFTFSYSYISFNFFTYTIMVCENFKARHARLTEKKKKQWSAREKLMIITYFEKGHNKHSTANKFGIIPKQLREWLSNKKNY